MKKYLLLTLLVLLSALKIQAQFYHFTQYPSLQPFFNPASDNNSYESRFKSFYRTQWNKLGDPYQSYGVSYYRGFQHYQFGFTGVNNQIGKGINELQLGISQGFNMHIDHNDLVTVSGKLSILQRKLSDGSLSFASQFDKLSNTYDPSLSSGENIANDKITKPTLALGAYWRHDGEQSTMYSSLSFANLNRPYQNFTAEQSRMYVRMAAQMGVNFRFGESMYIDPNILYVRQKDSYILNVFFNTHHRLSENMVGSVGIGYRKDDAFLFATGLAYKDFVLGASYDINLSPLTTYTNGRGAFELTLCYRIKHRDPHIMTKDTSLELMEHKHQHIKHPVHHPSHHYQRKPVPTTDSIPNKPLAKQETLMPPAAVSQLIDTDKDGIADSLDQCPNVAGKLIHLGCPDNVSDRDKDGVPDEADYCPDEFGAVAGRGCPLSKGKIWELFQKQGHLDDILFGVNDTKLLPKYHTVLDTIASRLNRYPFLTLVICGHSDKVGNSTYNLNLSKKRADAIEAYLQRKGVKKNQLQFFYYGESRPKHLTGKEDAGNRRVELFYTE